MQNNSKIETFVICGFLGAGKTTLLKNLTKTVPSVEKTVILVNDFGLLNIDQQILHSRGLAVLPLNNGCVCCSLRGELVSTILKISGQLAPKRLFIEPSGIASPYRIIETLEEEKLCNILHLKKVINVIDTPNFLQYKTMFGDFFLSQLECSDVIVLNKIDLITPDQLISIQNEIRSINPSALIYPTEYGIIPLDILESETQKGKNKKTNCVDEEEIRFDIFELALTDRSFEEEKLNTFFNTLGNTKFGQIFRVKGIFQVVNGHVLVNMVPGQVNFEPARKTTEQVVFFGKGLDKSLIQKELFSCVNNNEGCFIEREKKTTRSMPDIPLLKLT